MLNVLIQCKKSSVNKLFQFSYANKIYRKVKERFNEKIRELNLGFSDAQNYMQRANKQSRSCHLLCRSLTKNKQSYSSSDNDFSEYNRYGKIIALLFLALSLIEC